jgi:hypothetical protein
VRGWVGVSNLHEFARLDPAERARVCAKFDFYWGFYFISFATFNAAASFILVSAFAVALLFTLFAPILRQQLWFALLLSSGLGSIAVGTLVRKLLFTGVIATSSSIRYQVTKTPRPTDKNAPLN